MAAAALPTSLTLNELLPRLAEFTNDVVLITEAEPIDGGGPTIVYVNAAFTRMTGYAPSEVIGLTPRILQGPKTSAVARAQIRTALQNWQPIRIDLLNYRKDGSEFWVELSITPVADDAGWFRYWVAVQREGSQLQRFDEQRRLYELILANMDGGLVVIDALQPDAPVEFVNAAFVRMTGYSEDEILGRNCRQFQGAQTNVEARAVLRRAIEEGQPANVELLNYRKDGTSFWNHTSIAPLRDASGAVVKFVGVQRDLTNQKRREHEALAAQRLSAIGELTGGIAHDFNNLLTAIGGSAELLSQRVGHDADLMHLVNTIRHASQHGTSQVRRLLNFSRTPLLARGKVDLRAVLAQLQALLRTALRGDIALEIDQHPQARWVDAETVQLESALLNLVLNAQDAIKGAGRIRITTLSIEVGEDAMVQLEVTDSGCGMDEGTLGRLFEAFFTTKEPGRGSGLGLAMVHSFVSRLGGTIRARSEVGLGTTLTMTLRAATAGDTETGRLEATGNGPARPRRVLLVEDDEVVRLTAHAMLVSQGHEVVAVDNPVDALSRLADTGPFDVLFTDVMMPGCLSGFELAALAKARHPGLKVILTSGWADSTLPNQLSADSGDPFLLKPYTLADLDTTFAQLDR